MPEYPAFWLRPRTVDELVRLRDYLGETVELCSGDAESLRYECWLVWTGSRFEVEYPAGAPLSQVWAVFVCREVASRFQCQQYGASGAGWYPDLAAPEGFASWVEWLRGYPMADGSPPGWHPEACTAHLLRLLDAQVVAQFLELDLAAQSRGIPLPHLEGDLGSQPPGATPSSSSGSGPKAIPITSPWLPSGYKPFARFHRSM